ncbi:MAG: PAS-domain containing protein, partial [Rhizobiales bacterium]|nr:PAS-domain containing protein [Hyphomicrobiales bacterium]
YLGPILVFAFGRPLLQRIVDLAKRQNITSIADLIAARYGKSEALGALVAIIAVIGVVPYISIQLKAVSFSLETLIAPGTLSGVNSAAQDLAFLVAVAMAAFAILFGTRHIDTTEHQHGMMLAIAVESVVKLIAFVAVGAFVTFIFAGGPGALYEAAAAQPEVANLFSQGLDGGRWITMTMLAMFAIVLLPRQFHVTVVENSGRADLRRAAWLFPLYLVAINIFVVPIAVAGLLFLGAGPDGDTYVLALPIAAGSREMALIAFLGGLSASTAMVIVETIALSIMVCNNIVVPILVRRRAERSHVLEDMGRRLIAVRRWAIVAILLLAYSYYRMIGSSAALAQTGLISFAAVAQFAPALFVGLVWKRATARGAKMGLIAGFAIWIYTLLLPSFADAGWIGAGFVEQGPLGIAALKPRTLFYLEFDHLTHGVIWSLSVNLACLIGFSLMRQPTPIERIQAEAFVPRDLPAPAATGFRIGRPAVTVGQLETTVARYLGEERTGQAFAEHAAGRGRDFDPDSGADIRTVRFAEHLLASAIGPASSRLVMALLLERHSTNARAAVKLLDDASAAIQYNRDLLQSAIDNVRQGIAVFDRDHELTCWNPQFRQLLSLPPEVARLGTRLEDVVAAALANANYPDSEIEAAVADRVRRLARGHEPFREKFDPGGVIVEIDSSSLPDGGIVITFADITDTVTSAEALISANETLERRVAERTAELTRLNAELAKAKHRADEASRGKTRFIAAASHDILQPLNAARLFTSSLVDRQGKPEQGQLVRNIDASLEAVEEILNALLDISRLDAGAMRPDISIFRIDELLRALALEFGPMARARGLELRVVSCSLAVRSDRKLLRRILQNLVSNAIKYTGKGRVLMGCRRHGGRLRIEVHDTGAGIPESKRRLIFREFERLSQDSGGAPGLGLGLSIVDRIARMLKHPVGLRSEVGRGSVFTVTLPVSTQPAEVAAETGPATRAAEDKLAGLTILVVDNEPAILEGMRSLLEGWGCTVFLAQSAADARALWDDRGDKVDLILADYHLDGDDGLALIEAIRAQAPRMVPAILITADRSRQVQDLAAVHDVQCLRKPLRPAALRAAIGHACMQTGTVEAAE